MELLPLELEKIILDYKNQLEIADKYQKCLDIISKIKYSANDHFSAYVERQVYYTNGCTDILVVNNNKGNKYVFGFINARYDITEITY